jgi:predicted metallopeptidase
MRKSTWLYELVSEQYQSMSKDDLKAIIHELIYYTSESMNEKQEEKAFNDIIDTLKEYEII